MISWKKARQWLPGLLVSILALVIVLRLASWEELGPALANYDWRYLLPGVGLFLVSLLLRVVAWWLLLQRRSSYPRTFLIINEGYLLNNIFPFRLGELGRALLMGEATATTPFFVLSTIMLERLFDVALAAGLLLSTLPLVLGLTWARPLGIAALALVAFGLVILFFLARSRKSWRPWLERRLTRFPRFQHTLLRWLDSLLDGFDILNNPLQLLLAFGALALSWGLAVAEYYVMLLGVAQQAQFWWGGFVLGVVGFGVALPSAPASLGVFEASVVAALALLSVSPATALAYAVTVHLIHFIGTGLIGLAGLYREGNSIAGIYQRLAGVRTNLTMKSET